MKDNKAPPTLKRILMNCAAQSLIDYALERGRKTYKLAKMRERKSRDIDRIRFIKNVERMILVKDNEIRKRWRGYFQKLLNENSLTRIELEGAPNSTRLGRKLYQHRIQAKEYGSCVARKIPEVERDMCSKEFLALKTCMQKTLRGRA